MDIDEINIRRLDFGLLLIFQHLMKSRRTTVVAQQLGLSQSAISHALARLRDIFQDQLFLRLTDGLQPNSTALALAPKVDALIALAKGAFNERTEFDPMTSTRLFRIVTIDFVAALLAPLLQASLAECAPGVRFTIRFGAGSSALDAVRSDAVDFAIGRFDVLPADTDAAWLAEESYSVVARQGHPAFQDGLDLGGYLEAAHILVSFNGDFYGTADQALHKIGKTRNVVSSVPLFLSALATAGQTDAVSTVPSRLAHFYSDAFKLGVFDPPFPIENFTLSTVQHRRTRDDSALIWFAAHIRKLWNLNQSPNAH